jgi:hypothetical protein
VVNLKKIKRILRDNQNGIPNAYKLLELQKSLTSLNPCNWPGGAVARNGTIDFDVGRLMFDVHGYAIWLNSLVLLHPHDRQNP